MIENYYKLYSEAWLFCRKWLERGKDMNEDAWQTMTTEASARARKYGDPGAKMFLLAEQLVENEYLSKEQLIKCG